MHTDETTRAIQSILAREIDSQLQASVASPVVHFIELVVRVASYLQIWSQPYEALGGSLPSSSKDVRQDPVSTFRKHFLSLLHPLLVRREFVDALRGFLEHLLELADLPDDAQDTSQTRDQREQEQLRAQAEQAVRAMHYLSLFQRFEPILFKVVYRAIDRRLQDSAPDNFEALDVLSGMVEWLLGPIRQWMASIYCLSWPDYDTPAAQLRLSKLLRPIMQRFEHYVYTSLLKLRTKEAFDIVVDYPASLPAVRDLQACMSKLDQTNFVVTSLARQIKKRLLHPGADTRDILTTYINLIKVLKLLDPSSVLLTKVTRSVREYLRSRRDTIRCIVQGMVDEDGDLLEELRGTHTGDEENGSVEAKELREKEEEQIEDYTDEGYTWTPAPVDAPPDYTAALRKADIIQLLVSIYDTKEMFVKELQKLMAQRLLRVKNYDVDAELRNIEILKIRFGEAALAGLEVMFKDIADSKRIDTSVHAAGSAMSIPGVNHDQALAIETMHATILSHLYWPPLPRAHTASVRLAGQMQKMTRTYEHIYRQLKSEKRLLFLPHASSVTLDIQLKDRTLEVECNPLQASILELLGEKSEGRGTSRYSRCSRVCYNLITFRRCSSSRKDCQWPSKDSQLGRAWPREGGLVLLAGQGCSRAAPSRTRRRA